MKRIVATLGLAIVAAVSTLGGAVAQDASPMASPVSSPSASSGIPPIVWISDDFTPTVDTATPVEGAIALGSEYWIQFLPDGQLSLRADCNGGFGSYEMDGSNLTLGPIGTTLMLCPEGGQGDAYLAALNKVTSWSIDQTDATDKLVLGLSDGSSISFSPSLAGVVWQWAGTQLSNGDEIVPSDPSKFYLSFSTDGSVVGQIDCNRAFGSYMSDGTQISMMLATTRIFCGEDSQDTKYALDLAQVTSFVIRDGQLALALPMDAGIIFFDPIVE
ncbi:MAG TPA: META domain-containing protein [Thermomicrobiales bacterium]|nr:META domain-containing protein [Thermomicrobiales bacterium]